MIISSFIILCIGICLECKAQNIWTELPWPLEGETGWIPHIDFITESDGYLLGKQSLYFTSTGGISWEARTVPATNAGNLHFFDVLNGLLISDGSKLFRTSDGGVTWREITLNNKDSSITILYSFNFVESSPVGYIIASLLGGSRGVLPYTTDKGLTWNIRYFEIASDVYDIQFRTPALGIGIFNNYEPTRPYLAVTTDSGAHWERSDNGIVPPPLDGYQATIKYLSNGQWLSSFYYESIHTSGFYKSEDDGGYWNLTVEIPWSVYTTEFFGAQGYADISGAIYSTSDYGDHWEADSSPPISLSSFSVPSVNVAYAVGETGILKLQRRSIVRTHEVSSDLQLLPNPTHDYLSLSFEFSKVASTLEVFDALGRRMAREAVALQATSHRLDVRGYPPGVYYARLGSQTVRFIKQ